MIVTITTFNLAQPTTLDEITKTFQVTAPKYQGVAGLLSKNYWMSEDGRRVGGIYVWETRADADRLHTAEWKKFVRKQIRHGAPDRISALAGYGGQPRRLDQSRSLAGHCICKRRPPQLATSSLASAPTIDVKIRLAERDQRQAADSRTEIERYLNDPPPGRHALAQRNRR